VLGNEGGEWGLVSQDGKPSQRLESVKKVGEALGRLPELAQAKPAAARVGILYNPEAFSLIEIDGRTQAVSKRADEPLWSLEGTYSALHRAHIPIDFVHLEELKSGAAQRYRVLYLPYCYALDDQAVQALHNYVQNGGTVWADGLPGWKNEYGELRSSIPGGLGDMFGAEADDVYPVEKSYSVTTSNEQGGELWKLPLELKGGQVLLTSREGKPFAVRHQFGKGEAIYFASAVTLAYRRRNNEAVQKWIVGPALAANAGAPVKLEKGSGQISFHALVGTGKDFAVLSNWGPAETVVVSFAGNFNKVADALTGTAVNSARANGRTAVTMFLPAEAVRVLEANQH
jgi:beta-galactosidase GanA